MSQVLSLKAELRDGAGKGAARKTRYQGLVPAVIYGAKKEPTLIAVSDKELWKLLNKGHFMNSMVEIEINGSVERTLPRDVQFHPVTDRPLHVDFLRVSGNTTVTVAVPVRFEDEAQSPGLKRGGVLNIVRHEVELVCPADKIPDELVVSLKGLEVNDSLHLSNLNLPEGVSTAITDRDATVATVVAPSGLKSEEAAAEGEATA
ncbi:50S ribosomal protein L25/general stress protein Ctc [Pedomonas mirosovicensis]|uniref:50S ribosomal protein L25/general stress protein Ctc n=1 Tax=Pedomonas mirosovicensis TaxID=2908641 RepID=UPI0021687BC1|nr:50S ribosomal protein L25/general stress protein Ctc [Pedomonas mirosovicensis]MCH8684686.1 50S ribosomal protein L25/general stress protein Ctc [Pedomonas mirosovicensis]